jgi:hypothetical protein
MKAMVSPGLTTGGLNGAAAPATASRATTAKRHRRPTCQDSLAGMLLLLGPAVLAAVVLQGMSGSA